jgi:hypothetical protein
VNARSGDHLKAVQTDTRAGLKTPHYPAKPAEAGYLIIFLTLVLRQQRFLALAE